MQIFFIVDTETTGLDTKDADVIEVSALKVKYHKGKYEILDEFDTLVNPLYPLPKAIREFNEKNGTGINDEVLANAPFPHMAALAFQEFIGDKPDICGHNIDFDIKFLDKFYQKNFGIPFEFNKRMDTLKLARETFPDSKNHKLETIHDMTDKAFHNQKPGYHNSLSDCLATLDVLKFIMDTRKKEKMEEEEIKKNFWRDGSGFGR